jgi:hypothetical protein
MNPVARRLSVYSADPGRRSSIHSIPDRSRRQKSPALIDVLRAWGDSARTLRDWVHRFNAAGPDGTGSSTGRMFDGTPIAGPTGRVGEIAETYDSDEAGHAFRQEAGRGSDLMSATLNGSKNPSPSPI